MRLNSISGDDVAVILVPKPPKRAYNPRRPAGALLQYQLKHLEWAVRPAAERSPGRLKIKPAKTEAEAARRIAALTDQLHRQAAAGTLSAAVPAPGMRRRRTTRKKASPKRTRRTRSKKGKSA